MLFEGFEARESQQRARGALALRAWHAAHLQAELDVLPHGLPGKQRILLKHHAALGAGAVYLLAVDGDDARGRLEEARDRVEQRRLSAAGGPDDRDELARIDMDLRVGDGLDRPLDAIVAEGEVPDVDMSLGWLGRNLGHFNLHGITNCPAPRINMLDPRPSTPIAIMPSAMSAYWTSE